jgi:acyl-[acyl-carrier-protein]-phospholipid O-acyltransferase/long-chain-fatty-acid--[acyl-carrier-protein] ligase
MTQSTLSLLGTRRFLPLLASQTLGAINDNLFKNALLILITYRMADGGPELVTLGAGIFALPFLLLSATGGELADRLEKSKWTQQLKLAELGIMGIATLGFLTNSLIILFVALFLMGSQSALISPIKFALMPQHLNQDRLLSANGLMESGMFLGTLAGNIMGTLLIATAWGPALTSALALFLAAAGYGFSLAIPKAPIGAANLRIDLAPWRSVPQVVQAAWRRRAVFLAILGIAWFFMLGATFLAQFPNYTKEILSADQTVVTLFLTVFSVGIALGSLMTHRLLHGEITLRFVPFAAIGMAIFSIDVYFASRAAAIPDSLELMSVGAFVARPETWRILLDLFGLAVTAGIYVVPLYAFIQAETEDRDRSRIFAALNVLNASFVVVATGITMMLYRIGFDTAEVFLTAAIGHLVVLAIIIRLLPQTTVKGLLGALIRLLFRVEIRGLEHYPPAGERALVVVNHQSYLDAPILATLLPGIPVFAIGTEIAKAWWVRPWLRLVEAFPMDATNPMSTKDLVHRVREGRRCIIFPEGRITETGALMKVYEGPGMIADRTRAQVVPVRIDGAQYSLFSLLGGKVRRRLFPKITVTVLPPRHLVVPAHLRGRQRRHEAGDALSELMVEMLYQSARKDRNLMQALFDAVQIHGSGRRILEDTQLKPMSYRRLILGSLVLGDRLRRFAAEGERIGVLLPNVLAMPVTMLGLIAHRRVPALLNFTQGVRDWRSACQAAELRYVITSRRFLEQAGLGDRVEALGDTVTLVYLEDIRSEVGTLQKLTGLARYHLRRGLPTIRRTRPEEPAVVLFTSGSEGVPKGVVLSHGNLVANTQQVLARVDINPRDKVFNALPLFHSFGLTAGTIMPLLSGIPIFLYPTPLHYRIIPELVYRTNATVLFGTDTFLSGYARYANPYDFYTMRFVCAGAERVRAETRQLWMERFGLRIYEGYGATETSPVVAVNTPAYFRAGTVGRLLPGIEARLAPVEGVDDGGVLQVRGANIMRGYLLASDPGRLQPPRGGWYDTGDIAAFDERGFLVIRGRLKRFAKIGGEMVSLQAVEELAAQAYPGVRHAVIRVPEPRRGEALVLISEGLQADRQAIAETARRAGYAEYFVPRATHRVETLPVMGNGKVDYRQLQSEFGASVGTAPPASPTKEPVEAPLDDADA